jgi:hypothetical protein
MERTFQELRSLLSPPVRPFHTTGDWAAVERGLGTQLPEDYKRFIATYGQGKICRSLWINDYLALRPGETALGVVGSYLTQYEDIRAIGVTIPYPLFPEPGGLLPLGGLENGGAVNWRTGGPPSGWEIVVWDSDLDAFDRAEGLGLVPFLVELISMRWPHFAPRFDPEAFASPIFEPIP